MNEFINQVDFVLAFVTMALFVAAAIVIGVRKAVREFNWQSTNRKVAISGIVLLVSGVITHVSSIWAFDGWSFFVALCVIGIVQRTIVGIVGLVGMAIFISVKLYLASPRKKTKLV